MLIVGCDIGSETHYIRAIDARGRELGKDAFSFSNNEEGFEMAKAWVLNLAEINDKKQVVLGLEPTGHYWFALAAWMITNGIGVVQVNPYAVKQSKEIEDNSQLKDDRKDPKLIANLVKDGNYGMPYLPEKLYAELRRLSMFRDQLTEDRIRNLPIPEDILALGEEGLRGLWHEAKLRGRGYSRAGGIVEYAGRSVGLKDGTSAGREAVKWFAHQIVKLDEQLSEVESALHGKCREIPHAENILEIGITNLEFVICLGDNTDFEGNIMSKCKAGSKKYNDLTFGEIDTIKDLSEEIREKIYINML